MTPAPFLLALYGLELGRSDANWCRHEIVEKGRK